ncbi:hypothetical protein WDZ92_38585, partial [Nostoc sp. NIES-2111]
PRREEPNRGGQPAPEEPMDIGGLSRALGETGTAGRMSLTPPASQAPEPLGDPQMDEPVDAPFIGGVRPPGTVGAIR